MHGHGTPATGTAPLRPHSGKRWASRQVERAVSRLFNWTTNATHCHPSAPALALVAADALAALAVWEAAAAGVASRVATILGVPDALQWSGRAGSSGWVHGGRGRPQVQGLL